MDKTGTLTDITRGSLAANFISKKSNRKKGEGNWGEGRADVGIPGRRKLREEGRAAF